MATLTLRKPTSPDFYSGAYSSDYGTPPDSSTTAPYSPSRSRPDSDHSTPRSITVNKATTPGDTNFGPAPKDAYAPPSLGITTSKPDLIRDVYAPQLED